MSPNALDSRLFGLVSIWTFKHLDSCAFGLLSIWTREHLDDRPDPGFHNSNTNNRLDKCCMSKSEIPFHCLRCKYGS
jgi:hypothetical protein